MSYKIGPDETPFAYIMRRRGLTLLGVAHQVGASHSTILRIARGDCRPGTVLAARLVGALNRVQPYPLEVADLWNPAKLQKGRKSGPGRKRKS